MSLDVTIAVVPREGFSRSRRSLETLFSAAGGPCPLVYVDGGSPPAVAAYLAAEARARGFELLRTDYFLSPNEARNLAAARVATKYVLFADNDVIVAPDALERLVACAEETGAAVVQPLICIGLPLGAVVHVAGGDAHFEEREGKRVFVEGRRFGDTPFAEVRAELRRGPIEQFEFHCALLRTDALARLGPLDEGYLSALEHLDFSLLVRLSGGEIWLEPDAVATYLPGPPFAASDLPYYLLRWSEEWNRASVDRFCEKWDLAPDDPFGPGVLVWLAYRRRAPWRTIWRGLRLLGGRAGREWVASRVDRALDFAITRRARERRAARAGPA